MKVKALLTETPVILTLESTFEEAIKVFESSDCILGIPVVDDRGHLVNLVTEKCLLVALSKGQSLNDTLAILPSRMITPINENTLIEDLQASIMDLYVFVDNAGQVKGVLDVNALNIALMKNKMHELSVLDAFFECSYDGIYITDGKGNTLRINKSYERITGLKRENLLGRNMKALVNEGYISESGSLSSLTSGKTVTLSQTFKSGRKGLITSTPVKNTQGHITMVVTNVRDITELSDLKNKLEENKTLTEKYHSEIEVLKAQILQSPDLEVEDPKMLDIVNLAMKVAKLDSTVLILGESGVGKEEIAKLIHKNSPRSNRAFIKINCGAIPPNLIESELFGYEKGAFTGANVNGKKGLFEIADGGTFFLDEVGELTLDIQVKLLRVLQEQEITRIGGSHPIPIDIRIISATNQNLSEMVKAKRFREDLFYRLNVIPISIPPLKERKLDIFPLANHFLKNINKKYNWHKTFTRDTLDILYAYDWPGNVRELGNIVERAAVMTNSDQIRPEDLSGNIVSASAPKTLQFDADIMPLNKAILIVEKQLLTQAYNKYGNVRDAAKALEIAPATFVRKRQRIND
ncbi:sigma-54-dependent Fis family transcriptional regulator [Fusibacter ferrireducens]|uniref:Sigma 54-interacting transcriptional regulator n=1 Tax=Fusibacter ferrireducens TaxID=2785058 RepID=A0ABR9ZW61_9FIRM|nr:sigma-54-dependent Fis family transcriptional regulator [Fusibacter ferrireducens]MBF4694702.1 sigma 54-interacting transcriptional regulator [Fusibacter ferrireducens]